MTTALNNITADTGEGENLISKVTRLHSSLYSVINNNEKKKWQNTQKTQEKKNTEKWPELKGPLEHHQV